MARRTALSSPSVLDKCWSPSTTFDTQVFRTLISNCRFAISCLCSFKIRREDIRTGATEEIQIHEAFRPGDIVIAKIISMGDARRFTLTTAEVELGVIRSLSKATGKPMVAVSSKEVECQKSGSPGSVPNHPRICKKYFQDRRNEFHGVVIYLYWCSHGFSHASTPSCCFACMHLPTWQNAEADENITNAVNVKLKDCFIEIARHQFDAIRRLSKLNNKGDGTHVPVLHN